MKKVKQSFTLVEILVVIVIIGILSSFIFFTVNDSVEKANLAKTKMFEEAIRNNLLMNLVSEWKFDGDITDSWGNYDGTAFNGDFENNNMCVKNQCAFFNGINDSMMHPSIVFGESDTWSHSHWLYWKGYGVNPKYVFYLGVASTNNGLILRCNNDNEFALRNSLGSYLEFATNTSNQYLNNGWFHLTWTADGNNHLSLYVDGKKIDTISGDTSITFNRIGSGYSSSGGYYFNGLIDEVKIYNAAIPESQIKQEYLAGLNNLYAKGLITEKEYSERLSCK